MVINKITNNVEWLEDPTNPLLGPNMKLMYFVGLLQSDRKLLKYMFSVLHISSQIFGCTMFIDLHFMKHDIAKVLFNLSLSLQTVVCIFKLMSCSIYQSKWKKLFSNISSEEISQIHSNDMKIIKLMRRYTLYSRIVSYLYWSVVLVTILITVLSPFVTYLFSNDFHVLTGNFTRPYPQILSSWFPFDNTYGTGYFLSVFIQALMTVVGGVIIAAYDSIVVAVMSFFKGQILILREKCHRIFGDYECISKKEILINIKECHRLHNFITEQYTAFSSIVSPVMFIYVLICSGMICCTVVQLNLNGITMSQRLWSLEYVAAAGVQLFIFCWHSNEIYYESYLMDRAIFNSNWWRANAALKKQMLLLAGKLYKPITVKAGPFTNLSMPTFIEILKGAYSFYMLITKSTNK